MSAVISVSSLSHPWKTPDPFLFCAFHNDNFPKGNGLLGPDSSLAGRAIGQDFSGKDGWSMYHGKEVPGFPVHPHSGFETITIVEKGLVDHSDSLGAAGRFGNGDVQWMTAGKGVQHAEMFPLLNDQSDNPLLLFQIWLNLPERSRKADPHYKMFWHEDIPLIQLQNEQGKNTLVKVIAGKLDQTCAIPPPPASWASDVDNEIVVWILRMEDNASITLPKAGQGVNRTLYYYHGDTVILDSQHINVNSAVELRAHQEATIINGSMPSHFLMLQGRPIGEPTSQYGPFVARNMAEIQQAMLDYQSTQFGGWPWPSSSPVHDKVKGRFAKFEDGTEIMR